MTTGYVVNLENGHNGYCVESLIGVTYCGEAFDPTTVERELYAVDRGHDHPHNTLCFDCSKVDSRTVRGAVRGVLKG
ncbi:hypothetical protein [Natrinema salifodinae]|uniref:Uncharacterized protein n=1 Tax=Natrinema salifodinae TaxID=1202768 RepID=A0A1I0P813_9EURY|nr:hypothetical protein [Natrinema salifodinae]SEW10538.1 hypothetical protein SAMN05216285_2265 [Natrinema salifodinae]